MHIGIDGSRCGGAELTGVERYSQLVVPRLIAALKNRGHKVTVYARQESPSFAGANVKISKLRHFWSQFYLGLVSQLDRVDCLFVPSHVLPFFRPKNCVLVAHDICFEQYPTVYNFLDRLYLRLTTADAVREAKVVTHSDITKQQIEKTYGKGNVFVVKPAALPVAKNKLQLRWRKPYILYVGRIEAKKNIKLLLEAFDLLLRKRPELIHSLVLLGKDGYGAPEIHAAHEKMFFKDRIIFGGFVADAIRDQTLREASGLVLPSLCEGSSLVLLEARAARVSFAASNYPVCREVGGDKGIFVSKNTVEAWSGALARLIDCPETPEPEMARSWIDVGEEIADIVTV